MQNTANVVFTGQYMKRHIALNNNNREALHFPIFQPDVRKLIKEDILPKKKKKANVVFQIHWSTKWTGCFAAYYAAAVKAAPSIQTGFNFFNLWALEVDQAYQQQK